MNLQRAAPPADGPLPAAPPTGLWCCRGRPATCRTRIDRAHPDPIAAPPTSRAPSGARCMQGAKKCAPKGAQCKVKADCCSGKWGRRRWLLVCC